MYVLLSCCVGLKTSRLTADINHAATAVRALDERNVSRYNKIQIATFLSLGESNCMVRFLALKHYKELNVE